jgi:aminoglycoside 3'-phosphotransferase II
MNESTATGSHGELRFDEALRRLPPGWQAALADCTIEPAAGLGGASVFRVSHHRDGCRYLKLAWGPEAQPLRSEIARTEWLSSHHIRVPKFLMKACTEDVTACLMTAVPGWHLITSPPPCPAALDLPAAMRVIGHGLARLHNVPVADCPFDEMPRTRLARALDDIDHNRVDASQFDDRNAGIPPHRLYRRLASTVPAGEDIVVVHGDPTLENLLIGPDGELGFIDCGHAGCSDRYLDLAVVDMDLRASFGRDAAEGFIAAYGIRDWNDRKAAFFRDLYELF